MAEIDGTSKGLLGAFAVFALGSSIASLAYGIFLLIRYLNIEYNYGSFNLFWTSILLIVVGGLLVITVILGAIGAVKDASHVRLVTLILLFILFAILATIGVWGMVSYKTERLQNSINADLQLFKDKYTASEDLKKKADYLHQTYNCCSIYEKYDGQQSGVVIPDSCCVKPGCSGTTYPGEKYFDKGCSSVYFDIKSKAVFSLAILALASAGVILIALILYGVISHRARAGYGPVYRG
jgi:hypothetical protein